MCSQSSIIAFEPTLQTFILDSTSNSPQPSPTFTNLVTASPCNSQTVVTSTSTPATPQSSPTAASHYPIINPSTYYPTTAQSLSSTTPKDLIIITTLPTETSSNPPSTRPGTEAVFATLLGVGTGVILLFVILIACACVMKRSNRRGKAVCIHSL